jgi:hypothetical protein
MTHETNIDTATNDNANERDQNDDGSLKNAA